MKQFNKILLTLLLSGTWSSMASAESYLCDFNTAIPVSSHDFKVAPDWKHIVGTASGGYMNYYWEESKGVDNSGSLRAGPQHNNAYSETKVNDYLITPRVGGNVKISVKSNSYSSSYPAFIEVRTYDEDTGEVSEEIMTTVAQSAMESSTFKEVTLAENLDTPTRLALRLQGVYVDNFMADEVEISDDRSIMIKSVDPNPSSGTITWSQAANGTLTLAFKVTVVNNGNCNLTQNEENFTISLLKPSGEEEIGTAVAVPCDLAPGEVSDEFTVKYVIPEDEISSVFQGYPKFILKENLGGTSITLQQSTYEKYESVFVFCEPSTSATSRTSLSTPISFGLVSEPTTRKYEIRNVGTAPLEVVSVAVPDGYSINLDEQSFTLAAKDKKELELTLDTDGSHSGNLEIVYTAAGASENTTYQLGVSGTKLADGTWKCDFNNTSSTPLYPQGSIVKSNVSSDYQYENGGYNIWLHSMYTSEYTASYNPNTSLFYLPMLHADAGDSFNFEVRQGTKASSDSNPFIFKVYKTTDRNVLGEPVMTIPYDELPTAFEQKSLSIDEEGDFYLVFDLAGTRIDNLWGLTQVEKDHDIFISSFDLAAESQNNKEISAPVVIYTLKDEAADNYTAKLIFDGEEVAEATSSDLTANAKNTRTITIKYTPDVEETGEHEAFVRFTFTDGSVIESEKKTIKIIHEPSFAFGASVKAADYWEPTSDTKPIEFGKTNEVGVSKTYKIANWGTAPLTVTSITVPDGYSVDVDECVVPGKTDQEVNISFVAEKPGFYEGEIVITYNLEGQQTYTLPISGTRLDPTKWYVTFDGPNNGVWPEGTLHQGNVEFASIGTYSAPNYAIQSTYVKASPNRMFITPLLHAEKGETISIDAVKGSYYYSDSGIQVYAATDRNDLLTCNEDGEYENAVLLADICAANEDEATKLTDSYKTFAIAVPEAGDYYIGFAPYKQGRIDEIAGLTPVDVKTDLFLEGSNIPTSAMQNITKSGSVTLRNVLRTLEAGEYNVRSYVDGKLSLEEDGSVEVKVSSTLTEKGNLATVPVSFRSSKAGTFPVYFEVLAGDQVLRSETVDVTFDEEVLSSEKVVGDATSSSASVPLQLNYNSSESVSLYTPEQLGLASGDKISTIAYRGYAPEWSKGADKVPTISIYYEWTDDTEQTAPAEPTKYDTAGMEKIYEQPLFLEARGSSSDPVDIFSVTFDEPLVYEAGKSLRMVVRADGTAWDSNYNFIASKDKNNTYQHCEDKVIDELSKSWSANYQPTLYLGMVVEPRSVSGVVTDPEDNAVENAVVTLTSNDGDNIQYTALTDASGAYSINVIQSSREYDIEVKAEDLEEFENGVCVADESITDMDFHLLNVLRISDDGDHSDAPENAVIYIEKALNPGFNAVALPIALNAEEVEAIFGEDVIVLEFEGVTTDAAATVVNFNEVADKTMEAGKPYLIFADQESKEVSFKTKGALASLKTTSAEVTDFLATEKRTPVAEKMFVLANDNFVPAPKARAVTDLPAYSGYIKAPNATSLTFTTDVNIETGIEDAEIETEGEDVIYDLNGIRVKNPEKGIYIINGKAVRVK